MRFEEIVENLGRHDRFDRALGRLSRQELLVVVRETLERVHEQAQRQTDRAVYAERKAAIAEAKSDAAIRSAARDEMYFCMNLARNFGNDRTADAMEARLKQNGMWR